MTALKQAQTPRDVSSGSGPSLSLRQKAILASASAASGVRSPKWHLSTPRLVPPSGLTRLPTTPNTQPTNSSPTRGATGTTAGAGSLREWIQGIERMRNSDTVASLLRPPELSRRDVESIHAGCEVEMSQLSDRYRRSWAVYARATCSQFPFAAGKRGKCTFLPCFF